LIKNNNNKKTSPRCCEACQQAFDSAAAEFNRITHSAITSVSQSQNHQLLYAESISFDKWVSAEFLQFLEKEQHINLIFALAEKVVLGNNNNNVASVTNKNSQDESQLDSRIRLFLMGTNSTSTSSSPAMSSTAIAKLQTDLNNWFSTSLQNTKTMTTKDRALKLFGSEATNTQYTTMLLGRAILIMLLNKNKNDSGKRRDRDDDSSSSSESDEDQSIGNNNKNKKTASSSNSTATFNQQGFFDIIHLFKLTQPTTPKQLEIRSHCVAVICSVWIEQVVLASASKMEVATFPFAIKDFVSDSIHVKKQLLQDSKSASDFVETLRSILDCCNSVLPAAVDEFLVNSVASCEYLVAANFKLNKTQAVTRMRQFFESAIAQEPKNRNTWSKWKLYETKLGFLKEAGDVQRRASQALNDSRVL
jgi:hypothetical protein